MSRLIPNAIEDVVVFVDGKGYLGAIDSFQPPTITQKTKEAPGAANSKRASGSIEALELTFKLSVLDVALWVAYGINTYTNKVPLVLKASVHQNGASVPYMAILSGDFEEISRSEFKSGEKIEVSVKVQVHKYAETIDGVPTLLYDADNTILMMGGVDYFAKVRENLSL
jgi:P2 family phage contractile tail tube protein